MTCHHADNLTVCTPTYDRIERNIRRCFTCKRHRWMILKHEEWYGWTVTCCTCGDNWTNDGDGWERRPRSNRKERAAKAKREWMRQ